jgi:hypothetical protein
MFKAINLHRLTITSLLCLSAACSDVSDTRDNSADELLALQQRLSALQTELTRIQDIKSIKTLQRAYGYYVDEALWDEVADLFSSDGTIELALDGVYEGRERIRQMLYQLGEGRSGLQHGQLNEHLQLQPVVTVLADGVSAKARWRALIFAGQYGESAFFGEGTYENEYRKVDGIWMISKLHWYQTLIVPFEGGWANNRDATGGILVSRELPPDRPPTETYDVWPGVYFPPFHLSNPVSGRE